LAATLGAPDDGYARVEDVQTLRPLLAELPERERRVLTMRFVDDLTQAEIAERIGYSQMHISRILRAALDRLRRGLRTGPAQPAAAAPEPAPVSPAPAPVPEAAPVPE